MAMSPTKNKATAIAGTPWKKGARNSNEKMEDPKTVLQMISGAD